MTALDVWKFFAPLFKARSSPYLLIVEDNVDDSDMIVRHLKKLGRSFDVVRTAEDARALLTKNEYEIVFLDIGLPGNCGWNLFREMQDELQSHRVVVTCGSYQSLEHMPEGEHLEVILKNVTRHSVEKCLSLKRRK